jgi:integrase
MTITTVRADQIDPPFLNPAATTLAGVIAQLAELEPDSRRRRDMASAIQTVARVLNTPVAAIPADPSYIGRLIRGAMPARQGIGAARWSNVVSLLRRALKLAGCRVMAGKRNHPLMPAWQVLMDALPSRYARAQLSRFGGELSRRQIAPAEVTDAVFAEFHLALGQDSLLTNVRDRYQRMVVAWNRARATVPGWPDVQAPALPVRETYVRPLSDFPAAFQTDAQVWLEMLAGHGAMDEGPLKPVRQATLAKWTFAIRQMASALVLQGVPIGSITSLEALLLDGHDEMIVQFFFDRGQGASHQAHGMTARLTALARHHAKLESDARDILLRRLRRMSGRVVPETRGMTDKNRQALKPFEDEARRRQLVNLPTRVFAGLPRGGQPTCQQAVRLQTALAVAILLAVPMRARNLARLEFGRNLLLHDEVWWVEIAGTEVKNGQAIEMPLPEHAGRLLELYRQRVLPVLADATCRFVFPGGNGSHKAEITQAQQIKLFMARELGCSLSPHQFRHLVGYLYLLRYPHGHEVVRILLGHRSIETTIRFYAGMEGLAAARQYDAMMQTLRDAPVAIAGQKRNRPTAHRQAGSRRRAGQRS